MAIEAGKKIAEFFRTRNVQVFSVNNIDYPDVIIIPRQKIGDLDLDLVFAVGGDGTTLRTFRMVPNITPVFSINIGGTRGILAEVGHSDIRTQLEAILKDEYFLDSRIRLQAEIEGNTLGPALNDVVITRTNLTRTPLIRISLLNEQVSQRMDGIIISTPTGSTGHSLSLDGPIIHEQVNCLLIHPVAPVNKMPCLIVEPQEISITSSHDSKVVIDGQDVFDVKAESCITISRYQFDGTFVRLNKRGIQQVAKLGF
ncbi:MAG: NAD(+)/NADH kinase [Thermoproteota archaeon]|nr:NAD(+)/NADH kinase [Thermoproteota archaeon]